MKQQFSVSVHVDRAEADFAAEGHSRWVRLPPQANWSAALQEVTRQTAGAYGSVIVGLHSQSGNKTRHEFFHYSALANRRNGPNQVIDPGLPQNRLYEPGTLRPLPDIATRYVAAEVLQLMPGSHRADDHMQMAVDKRAFERGKAFISQAAANPLPYNIQRQNCASFARDLLKAMSVTIPFPADMPIGARRLQRPAHFSELAEKLAQQDTQQPGTRVLTATPLLLG